jgi:ABC-type multidrug transport system ATPase subunit
MTLNKKQGERKLLNDVWGEVPPGEITAIMGPSGAGKTSLLNILAGRCRSNSKITVESDIRMKDFKVDPTNIEVRKQIAFVAQDDSLSFTATPREAIRFSAKLRLPRITTDDEIEELADKMLKELGLKDCADTMIGGNLIKGISGGERKRTSVGVELVTKPSLVFLDEPTSGLDSFSAMQVIRVLKKIAHAGCSVLFTIHQPSSDVFNSFDRLILLNKGMVMYQGPVDDVPDYFAQHNHPMPKNYNPADWIMEVAQQYSQDQLLQEGFFSKDERNLSPAIIPKDSELLDSLGVSRHEDISDDEWKHVGFGTEARLLFKREIIHNSRNKKGVGARFALTTFMAFLVGNIFFGVGNVDSFYDVSKFNSHFGAMVMILMMSMFGTAMPTLLSFPEERPVFLREYSTNHYSVIAYFMSRLAMEALITFLQVFVLLIIAYFMVDLQAGFFRFLAIEYALAMSSTAVAVLLGCAVEDPTMATEFLPLLFVPQLLFAGFFVRTDLIPPWLRWAQYLCALTYGVRLALLAEFGDCANDETIKPNICSQLLEVNEVKEEERAIYWAILWGLFLVFRLGGLTLLRKKATKFY